MWIFVLVFVLFPEEVNFLEIVKLLLENSVDVNSKTSDGTTALIEAAYYDHIEIVTLLLQNPEIDIFAKGAIFGFKSWTFHLPLYYDKTYMIKSNSICNFSKLNIDLFTNRIFLKMWSSQR